MNNFPQKKSSIQNLLDWLKAYLHPIEEFADPDINSGEEIKKVLHKFKDLD